MKVTAGKVRVGEGGGTVKGIYLGTPCSYFSSDVKGLAIVAAVIPRVLFFLLLLPSPSTSTSAGRNLRRQARPIRFNEHHPTTSTEEEEENWKSLPKVSGKGDKL